MQTVRRLYLYTVSILSLVVVLWGTIQILRSVSRGSDPLSGDAPLAESLSLLLVGLPVFLLHGWLAQRSAAQDSTERSSRVRAIFLYGTLFATLLSALVNFLAVLNSSLLSFFEAGPGQVLVGGDQTGMDNLVAILVNLVVAALVFLLLRSDWRRPVLGNAFAETRRLYRLLWLVAGVALIVSGLSLVLHTAISLVEGDGRVSQAGLPGGLSLLLVGLPSWYVASRQLESTLSETEERRSFLRVIAIYALAFAGLVVLLLAAGFILESLLRALFVGGQGMLGLLEEIRLPLSIAIPMGLLWAYYNRQLQAERHGEIAPARHTALHRLYRSIFAFLGLAASFISLQGLLEIGLAAALASSSPGVETSGEGLASAFAGLLVGFPTWLYFWRALQAEAGDPGEGGDRARRSLVRKVYLYGILMLGVAGLMSSLGQLVTLFIQSALGGRPERLLRDALPGLKNISLFALILATHGWVLRRDARRSEGSLARRRTLYPVLVLVPDEGDFAGRMVSALEHYLPGLPIAVHPVSSGAPDESLSAAKAVILPFEILAKPPEAVRLWLQSFTGERLVVPSQVDNWHWVAGSRLSSGDPAQTAALAILERVEGNRASEE